MKRQILFSGKKKKEKNVIILSSAMLAHKVVKDKLVSAPL